MDKMRALVITGPARAQIDEVSVPTAGPGQVVVDVHRVGVCGTDVEMFTGSMAYFAQGRAWYPLRPGHEWSGVVGELGPGVDQSWFGARVTGDTMLGCGMCDRCRSGKKHVCRNLVEVGISMGFAGALAERLLVPVDSLHRLPDTVDDCGGAMVEPGGNAWRAAAAACPAPGIRLAVWGPGTIGLLTAAFTVAAGAEVHVIGPSEPSLGLARELGVAGAWRRDELPNLTFDAVIDATNATGVPAAALDLVEPGGRVVYIGLAGSRSDIDTRTMVLKDVTAVGILSASPGLAATIAGYADGTVSPGRLVAGTVGLVRAVDVLAGWRPPGKGTKVHIDPRL
jgi:threonine dehydrogenase-like Zn-dependent dehydrogenase